jgi:hypothetical protein
VAGPEATFVERRAAALRELFKLSISLAGFRQPIASYKCTKYVYGTGIEVLPN